MAKDRSNEPWWCDEPDEMNKPQRLGIMRTPASQKTKAIILSTQMVGGYTHYAGGRTQPCRGQLCRSCQEGQPPRWYGWMHIISTKLSSQAVYEITSAAAQEFLEWRKKHGALRGAMLVAERVPKKVNGRLSVRLTQGETPAENLPPEIDLRRYLESLWKVHKRTIDEATHAASGGNNRIYGPT